MRTTVNQAMDVVTRLLTASGLTHRNARTTAMALVLAELWGVGSHGLLRLPHYLRRLEAGGYTARPELAVTSDRGAVVIYDGEGGLGHWQLWHAAETAAARAQQYGVGVAAVGNSGHCGALGVYVLPALAQDQACLVFSNGPAVMPAWGGSKPLLSTSPLAIGIPDGEHGAIIDMASSSVARGKIAAYASRNEPLPEGWALDAEGSPTTDPHAALMGMLAPMGGAKGFALALVVESFTGGLVGPALSSEVTDMFNPSHDTEPQRIAHLIVSIDAAGLEMSGDSSAGHARMLELFRNVRTSGGRVPGGGKRPLRSEDGERELTVPDNLAGDLLDFATRHKLDLPGWVRR